MKLKVLLRITAALVCLLLVVCMLTACGDKEEEPTDPATEATDPTGTPGGETPGGTVEDNDDASDIGPEVILPTVNF